VDVVSTNRLWQYRPGQNHGLLREQARDDIVRSYRDEQGAVKPDFTDQFFNFTRSAWQFGRGDGSLIARRLQFQAGGRIQHYTNWNERFWMVRNGNLCLLNAKREVTTEFTVSKRGENGRLILEGKFLPGGKRVTHVLTEIPRPGYASIPNPAPRVAVLVRTHLVNEKLEDLLAILSDSACFDLYVCADCTRVDLEVAGVNVLRHRLEDAEPMGLPTSVPNLFWYCGDYALYFAHAEIPNYDYYFMIEYDVHVVDRGPLVIEGIINRLGFSGSSAVDFVGCRCGPGNFENGWGMTVAGVYPEAQLCQFPFVVLSRRAIEYLLSERQAEKKSPMNPSHLMFCEAFVPSALNAGGFRRIDINSMMPGTVTEPTFRIADDRGPMLLGQRSDLAPTVKLLHPVYDEINFVKFHLQRARNRNDGAELASLVDADSKLSLSRESREMITKCMDGLPLAHTTVD
jgi:hypothetical protein